MARVIFQRRQELRLALRPNIQAEVPFQVAVLGFIVTCIQVHPFLVRHLTTPLQEGSRVGTHRVAQLPSPALNDFHDLLSNQRGWYRILQRGLEKRSETHTLRYGESAG